MGRITGTLALVLAAAAGTAAAQQPAAPQAVEIKGVRNPELKTYRVMLAGLDAFDDYHAFAPNAPEVRFRLRSRVDKDTNLDDLAIRLSGDTVSLPLPLDENKSFALPRNEQAESEDAEIVANKPKGGIRWQPDVRTPGVPDGMRRLGDLRLECRVLIATAKKEIGFMLTAFINSVLLTTDWCGDEKIQLATPVPKKIAGATLLHDGQRIALKIADRGKGYLPPLADKRYPDDALIEVVPAAEQETTAPP
ncbi:hypothetical protein [Pseudoduganella rhizocola]|uniref:hypothetical protein n=1 Tax=Pseudoduganella rhizocola TaxID=3382643 RepID=UPI0038B4EB2B